MFRYVLTFALRQFYISVVECFLAPRPGLPALEQLHALADARKNGTCVEHVWNILHIIACHPLNLDYSSVSV